MLVQSDELDCQVRQAKKFLQKGRLVEAKEAAERVLSNEVDNVDALYIIAVSNRYLKKHSQALATLKKIKAINLTFSRAYQEEGHVYRALKGVPEAIVSFEQAVSLNPALVSSWKSLHELYEIQGKKREANNAIEHFLRLSNLPAELLSVTSMIHEGMLLKAEEICRAFLQKHKHHIEAMRLLAELGKRLFVLDDAEFLLESCVELEPENNRARLDYVNVLHKRQKFKKALEQATILRDSEPDNLGFEITYANECLAVGDFEKAIRIYKTILNKKADMPNTHLFLGHAQKTMGCQQDAIVSYRNAYALKSDFGDAYWSLANLKTYKFSEPELQKMKASEASPSIRLDDRFHLCFALGKAHEDLGEYRESFQYYELGNELKKTQLRYSAERTDKEFKAQIKTCTEELFTSKSGQGCDSNAPIFIVGLPRAGSTLLEQILASHSQVDGTMELPNILAYVHRLNGRRLIKNDPRYPDILWTLTPEFLRQLGEDYIRDTQIYRKGAAYFIDKMPNNFRHIGLIQLILPNAKIIDARRHPMACCLSNFKQLYAEGQEFTYGLEDIGRYYKAYTELMDYWDGVLAGKILRIQYEEVVTDLETQVRKILDFCGLEYEDACLDFHESNRNVHTASSEQVRQPIYTDGLTQWRHFESYLDPLKSALMPIVKRKNHI
jgi:tetratricopeptide (TPR) repeat protein